VALNIIILAFCILYRNKLTRS